MNEVNALNINAGSMDAKKTLMGFGVFLAVLAVMMLPDQVIAGTGGSAFEDVWLWLKDNIEGTLGRIVCGAIVIVGIIAGIARQSLMAFAIGIGGGMGLYNTPTIIESIVSATIEHAEKATTATMTITNGLGM